MHLTELFELLSFLFLIGMACYGWWCVVTSAEITEGMDKTLDSTWSMVYQIHEEICPDEDESTEPLDETTRKQFNGWMFEYDPGTRFVGGSHPNGGRNSVAEIMCDNPTRDKLGHEIAEWMNSGEDDEF